MLNSVLDPEQQDVLNAIKAKPGCSSDYIYSTVSLERIDIAKIIHRLTQLSLIFKQDNAFFQAMREGMEMGGYRLLLRFLKNYSLAGFDPNRPPSTGALLDQKHATLSTEHEWWLECLTAGRLISSDFGDGWPERISTERFRAAVARYAKERNVRSRVPSEIALGKAIRKALPAIDHKKRSGNTGYDYVLPSLADCRAAWDKFIGHEEEWG